VDDIVNAVKGSIEPVGVADVADKEPDPIIIAELGHLRHFVMNFLPNEPVPPVIKTTLPLKKSITFRPWMRAQVYRVIGAIPAPVGVRP